MHLWELVGRDAELGFGAASLAAGAHGLAIAGPAGVGKSRLASEILERAIATGHAVQRATASRWSSQVPFAALLPLLPPTIGDLSGQEGLNRVRAALLSEDRPTILAVDDAHLLDDASAALVHQLVVSDRVALVATLRTGEEAPPAVSQLWRAGVVDRLELQPLARFEADRLAELALGGLLEPGTERRLWEATLGNPLLLREVLIAGLDAGNLVEQSGVWRWRGLLVAGPRLVEVVRDRIGSLDDELRRAVELLSLAEPIPTAVIEALVAPHDLLRLERLGVVRGDGVGAQHSVRLAHPLYADVLRSAIPPLAQRALAGELVDALEAATTASALELTQLASLYLASGRTGDPGLLAAASRQSTAMGDPTTGEWLARLAITEAPDRFSARAALVRALHGLQRDDAALPEISRLGALAEADDELVELVQLTASVGAGTGTPPAELERSVADLALRASSDGARTAIAEQRARLRSAAGDWDEALRLARPIVEDATADPSVRVRALRPAVLALLARGHLHDCLELVDRTLPLAESLRDPTGLAVDQVLVARVLALIQAGWLTDADDLAVGLHERSALLPWDGRQAITGTLLGAVRVLRGAAAEGRALLRASIAGLVGDESEGLLGWALVHLALGHALLGDADEADRALADARALPTRHEGAPPDPRGSAEVWTLVARGRRDLATARLSILLSDAVDDGRVLDELDLRYLRLRLGVTDELTALAAAAGRVDGPWAAGVELMARALLDDEPAGLERAASAFSAMGSPALAFEAISLARDVHHRNGHEAEAAAAELRAAALRPEVNPLTAQQLRAPATLAGLTPREVEIATMAAQGLANRAIAVRLGVSVRTVEGHLARTFVKLGLSSRADLRHRLGVTSVTADVGPDHADDLRTENA